MLRFLTVTCLLGFALALVSCSASLISPKKGITDEFFQVNDGRIVNLANYDFSRLDKDYGLCVFSYEFTTRSKGNRIVGWSEQVKEGIRVWEYRFKPVDNETKWLEKPVSVWGYRSAVYLWALKRTYVYNLRFPFRRGQIVYAGRLLVSFPHGWRVESHFEQDMSPWLEQHRDHLPATNIESVMIKSSS